MHFRNVASSTCQGSVAKIIFLSVLHNAPGKKSPVSTLTYFFTGLIKITWVERNQNSEPVKVRGKLIFTGEQIKFPRNAVKLPKRRRESS